jgi:uncharacterized phage protein (TIGR01671 family)
MRQIEFRGKDEKINKWIYGSLLDYKLHSGICISTIETEYNGFFETYEDRYREYTVIAETVGQYTGLKDKNDVKIFEGDIIRYNYENEVPTSIQVVVEMKEFPEYYLSWNVCTKFEWEVIGNIHDNPELLLEEK